jgi:hypothetical protein
MIEVGGSQASVHALRRCGDADGITRSHIELGQAVVQQHASLSHAIAAPNISLNVRSLPPSVEAE